MPNSAPIFKAVLTLVCSSYFIATLPYAVTQDHHHMLTSLNSSRIVLKIPKNYKPNIPIFSFLLLRSSSTDYGKNYPKSTNGCGKTKSSSRPSYKGIRDRSFRRKQNQATRNRRDEIIAKHNWKGGSNKMLRYPQDFIKLSPKHKDLFDFSYSTETALVSIYLKRSLELNDYASIIGETSVKFDVLLRPPSSENIDCKPKKGSSSVIDSSMDQLLLEVVLEVIDSFNCRKLTEEMCLLPDNLYLQQWENEPPGLLFTLPSLKLDCPNVMRILRIKMDGLDEKRFSPELSYDPNLEGIQTNHALDRELRDSWLNFTITCDLIKTKKKTSLTKDYIGSLHVKDVDDSPPIRMKAENVKWKITDDIRQLDDRLMIIDPDIQNNKNYSVNVIGDIYNLVFIESLSEFEVYKKDCENGTSTLPSPLSAGCTIITPLITFDKCFKQCPPEIHFTVELIDNSLKTTDYGPTNNKVVYNITLEFNEVGLQTIGCPDKKFVLKTDDELSLEANVTIHSPLQIHSRLYQMLPAHSELHFRRERINPRTFSIAREIKALGLDITPVLGILFISEPKSLEDFFLKNSKNRLEVIITRGTNFTSSVFVEMGHEMVDCDQTKPKPSYITMETSCSIYRFRNECEKSCGVGSLNGKCSWRSFNGSHKSTHFATCSPDLTTCPDGFCDELEMDHKDICPQDCVEEHRARPGIDLNDACMPMMPPRGILRGFGVCTCNDFCQCFPFDEKMMTSRRPGEQREKIGAKGFQGESCGAACQVGLSIGIVLALFLLVIIFCRRRKDCGGKFKDGDVNQSHYPSDFIDDHSSSYASGPVHGETHAVARHAVHNIHSACSPRINNNDHDLAVDLPLVNFTVDRKWEFPRSQLVIEQTLGEGEFGKVMKGRATGLRGQPGTTIVAVKMLKSNSTSAELGDLMSEYKLLKEVNHPNVIRLLGACTTQRGPIYLLIEYCKYGSLRSYLRRSRHFELESRVGSTPHEDSPGDYQLTPKHLLSFAWQVCKGMAYLGNMKLVHRDLAARNVLLAEGKICKISDFGLTRDIYEGDLYFKRSKSRVPVKWMSIESLADHVYTYKSDIWGFGVLLWELVTLGSSPYPAVTPERLFTLLKSGYRMEKPDNCSDDLYGVMKSCWHADPSLRPSFNQLVSIFEKMIEADVEYLELRSLIVTNRAYFDNSILINDNIVAAVPRVQVKDVSPLASDKELKRNFNHEENDETKLDQDSYLLARSSLSLDPPDRRRSTEPLLENNSPSPTHMTFHGTNIHAHNPAYSPSREDCPSLLQTIPPPLQYSSLASGPDEEEDVGIVNEEAQDGCRSEGDSDSGRATGDSGYLTEDGRKAKESQISHSAHQTIGKSLGFRGSYSPIETHELEDEQDTSEDFEEQQELLNQNILNPSENSYPLNSKSGGGFQKENRNNTPPVSSSSSSSSTGMNSREFVNLQRNNRRSPVQV